MKCGSVLSNDKFWTSICYKIHIYIYWFRGYLCQFHPNLDMLQKKFIYEIILEDTKDVVFSIIDAKTQPLLPHFCNSCSFLIVGGALFAWTTSENY